MDVLRVTIVGQDIFKLVEQKCELVGLNTVNQINYGMLGNLKTLTLSFELPQEKIIKLRTMLMENMAEDNMRIMPMFVFGDWMRVFVFKPIVI